MENVISNRILCLVSFCEAVSSFLEMEYYKGNPFFIFFICVLCILVLLGTVFCLHGCRAAQWNIWDHTSWFLPDKFWKPVISNFSDVQWRGDTVLYLP